MKLLGTVAAETMKSSGVHFWPGDVLYGRLRPYLNKVYCPDFEGLCSAEFIVFPASEDLASRYLLYLLNTAAFVAFASHLNEGDRPRVDFDQIASYPFPLPPLLEQYRIANEVDTQLTRLDAATMGIKRCLSSVMHYRKSILAAACQGRLVPTEAELARAEGRGYETAEDLLLRVARKRRSLWHERKGEQKSRAYKDPWRPDVSGFPALPEGWAWASWDQIGFCQNGRLFPSSEYQPEGVKLLRPGNLKDDGSVVWNQENTRRLPEDWAERYPGHLVGPGEIIMNLTAQSLKDEFLGRTCITGPNERCLLNQRLARLTPTEVSPKYLLWLFKSPLFRRFVDGLNTGSLIQHMFTSQISEFVLPLPPLAEQVRIADEIERRLSLLDSISASIEAQENRESILRRSILKSAFQGGLVGQESSVESASILLERIRQSRATREREDSPPRRGAGIKPGASAPGPDAKANPKPRRGGGSVRGSASAPSGLPDELESSSLGLKPQALRLGPFGGGNPVPENPTRSRADERNAADSHDQDFLALSRAEQIDLIWDALLGLGVMEKDDAVRTVALFLRDEGRVHFQRLRTGGPLYNTIGSAIDRGIREGSFDRPKRGHVRALLTDARDYSGEDWHHCLLESLNHEATPEGEALRSAAEWARENMGLEFARLREDGVILRGLKAALKRAIRRGEVTRMRGLILRSPEPAEEKE